MRVLIVTQGGQLIFIIFFEMGCVSESQTGGERRRAAYQNETDLQKKEREVPSPPARRPVPQRMVSSEPKKRDIWVTEAPEITHQHINGRKLARMDFSNDIQNEALLTSAGGQKIDRRQLTCSNCVDFYPTNCIGLIHAEYSDQSSTSEAKGTAFMISELLALTSAHTFSHINPDTNKILIVPPRKLYLGLVGEFIMSNEKNFNPDNFFKVEDFKINEKYIENTEKIAALQKNISENHTRMTEKQIKEVAERIHDLKVESEEYDYALIKLDRKVPLRQFLKLRICGEKTNKEVKVQGYEVFKTSPQSRTLKQYFHAGNVNQETKHALYYNVDTKTQQSGSPVLWNNNGETEVVALHKGYNPRINLNVGTKVTQELISVIKSWGREMKAGFRVQRSMTIDEQMDEKSKEFIEKVINEKEAMAEEHAAEMNKVQHELDNKQRRIDRNQEDMRLSDVKIKDLELQITRLKNTVNQQQFYLERKGNAVSLENTPLKELQKTNQRLTEEVHRKNLRIKNYEKEASKKAAEIESLRERLSLYENDLEGNLTGRNSVGELTLSRRNSMTMIENFEWDSSTPFFHYFNVDNRVAQLKDGGERYQIVSKDPLMPRSLTIFRITKYGGTTCMSFGIITEERREERWSGDQEDSVGFLTYPNNKKGIIRINGEAKTEYISACFVPEGHELAMELDRTKMSIAFKVEGGKIMSFSLPEMFRDRKLFVYVMMASSNDTVEVVA